VTRRVVITGVGAVTPLGNGAQTLIERWSAGDSGIEDGFGRCRDFEPLDYLSKKEARRADRFTQFAIAAGKEAIEQAWGEDGGVPYDPYRVGCVIATGIGGLVSLEREQEKLIESGPKAVSPLAVPLMMANAATAAVSMRHGLQGECYAVASACAAGTNGLGDAARMIRAGSAEAVVAGGAEAGITGVATAAVGALGATSPSGRRRRSPG
jgi:3-oxoacyl-[acyl-carrier-protein] synthase II